MLHQLLKLQQLRKSNQKEAAPRQSSNLKQLVFIWSRKQVPFLTALKKRPVFCPDKYGRYSGNFAGVI
jgi:serine/threonine-protein kinase RIO1